MTKNDFNFSVTFTVATCYIADDVSLVINRNIYINYEKTLMIIQNSRHILFDRRRETKVTLNKLVTSTYSKNPGI